MPFTDTENKATIRRQWDRALLQRRVQRHNYPLIYFGLPGPDICDLLDWNDLLDRRRTGVESIGRTRKEKVQAQNAMGRLTTNLFISGISSGFQLLRGDVEDILLDGLDHDGARPLLSDDQPAHSARFRYDVVNLDFDGGIGYKDRSGAAKRVAALKKLFERQEGHSFLLFLTINVRDTMENEIEQYLRGLQVRIKDERAQGILGWYLGRPDGEREYKLKAAVPSFIQAIAEARVFRCVARPPIAYEGHKRAHMIHFSFELDAVTANGRLANLRGFSTQNEIDLIQLPLLRCEQGRLQLAEKQHPGFQAAHCAPSFDFLPEERCSSLLASVTPQVVVEINS